MGMWGNESLRQGGMLVNAKEILKNSIVFTCILLLISGVYLNTCNAESFLKTRVEKIDAPKLNEIDRIKQVLRHLDIPRDVGFVKEIHTPTNPSEKLVINIQDLHCHYQAQKNIAALIDHLTDTFGLKLVGVEGGSGKIDTTFYKELPDEKVKEQVADYFLREARINGTEYFAINTKKDIALYGVEDPKYYDKNLDAFLTALPKREKIMDDIAVLENDLNILKDRIYNKRLKELDDTVVAYENGSLPFEDYVVYVAEQYEDGKLKRDFRELAKLVDSIRIKRNLNLEKVGKQREKLVKFLTKKLPRLEMEDFLKITMEFKAKTIKGMKYHNKVKELYDNLDAKTKTLDRAWPELSKYIVYLNKYETLDNFAMFTELDKAVDRVKRNAYTSYTQKKLDHNLKTIRLARNLFATKLLNRDIPSIKKYRSDFNSKKMAKFIASQAKRLKLDLPLPTDMEEMEKTLPIVEDFYYYASKRDNILAENTLNSMKAENECIGILVAGGFHSDGVGEYFKDKKISYIVLAPYVDELEEDDTRYINALQGKKTPFEEQLEREEQLAKNEEEQE
ncbi:MAG: hypothetical protein GY853_03705 [PVC group bacterium]|nr:hypothetical protein [PVC group bacterium]